MRSIRRAAIAGATAASLILGAASVATAEEGTPNAEVTATQSDQNKDKEGAKDNEGSSKTLGSSTASDKDKEKKKAAGTDGQVLPKAKGTDHCNSDDPRALSSCIGDKTEADLPVNGARLWGSTSDSSMAPKWAQYMKVVTIVGVLGSFLGLVVFPAYNFAVANHLLPGQAPR